MKKKQIGISVGIIWKALDSDLTDTENNVVMKETKLKKEDFYMGIGWIARENKIRFHTADGKICIFLIY